MSLQNKNLINKEQIIIIFNNRWHHYNYSKLSLHKNVEIDIQLNVLYKKYSFNKTFLGEKLHENIIFSIYKFKVCSL